MNTYTLMAEDFTRNMNTTKQIIFEALEREGKLKDGVTADLLSTEYAVIAVEPSWLGSVMARLWKDENRDKITFQVVKRV
jgi:hypothetical protein